MAAGPLLTSQQASGVPEMDPGEYARTFKPPTRIDHPPDRGANQGVLRRVKGRRAKRALDAVQVRSTVGGRVDGHLSYRIEDQVVIANRRIVR